MRNKGVTLISLVVTIIVLLILAGITIGTIFNDNGIIKKAQEAANATEEAAKNDQAAINGLLNEMDSIINGIGGGNVPVIGSINGKITWSTGSATLTLTTDVEGVTIQYRKNSESNWTNYTSAVPSLLYGDKVYARGIKGGETVINEKEFSKFQEYYKNMSPYYALTSFSFNQFAYVNKDKDLLLIKEIDKNQLFAYRLYKKQSY